MKKGAYFKLVGGYDGVVWTGTKWERFDCQRCAILKGIAEGAPLQGPMSRAAGEAMLGPVHHRHDVEAHAAWIFARQKLSAPTGAKTGTPPTAITGDNKNER